MINERELKLIEEITEIGLHLAELKAENRILKDVNEKLMQALRIHDVVGRSEQFYCVSSNALVYRKPCEKWCGDENCKALCTQ